MSHASKVPRTCPGLAGTENTRRGGVRSSGPKFILSPVRFHVIVVMFVAAAMTLSAQPGQIAGENLTLDQAIQETRANDLDLAAEKYGVSVAQARQIAAGLRPSPVLTVSGQTLNLLGAAYSASAPLGPNQLNIHTDFPLERGRKRAERMAVASTDKSLAEPGVFLGCCCPRLRHSLMFHLLAELRTLTHPTGPKPSAGRLGDRQYLEPNGPDQCLEDREVRHGGPGNQSWSEHVV